MVDPLLTVKKIHLSPHQVLEILAPRGRLWAESRLLGLAVWVLALGGPRGEHGGVDGAGVLLGKGGRD